MMLLYMSDISIAFFFHFRAIDISSPLFVSLSLFRYYFMLRSYDSMIFDSWIRHYTRFSGLALLLYTIICCLFAAVID